MKEKNERRNSREVRKNVFSSKGKKSGKRRNKKDDEKRKGPRLPNNFRKEIELLNPKPQNNDDENEFEVFEGKDIYEFEDSIAHEDSKKNRRYDPVENLEYELPDEFEDENVSSSDEDESVSDDNRGTNDMDASLEKTISVEEQDKDTRNDVIEGIPDVSFEGKKKDDEVLEQNLELDYDGNSHINIHDLLDPLHGKPGYSILRKRIHQLQKSSTTVQAPLPKNEQEKLERKAAYKLSKKDITKWEPLVKKNREAPTIYFNEDINIGFSTVGAIASEFKPRTEFEKKMASLVNDEKVIEAHNQDGAKLLELNMISVEDVKDRQNRLAKMRSLLFRHEIKAKHIKKIKSKVFHRMLKKEKLKSKATEMELDPEEVRELSRKQEFKRAEERMTLKHKNSSKWAKRILKRGLSAQDDGTRAAISDQLHQHELLTRKMNSINEDSSSNSSSDDDISSEDEGMSNLLIRAKEKISKAMDEDTELREPGVLSLPFMIRGMKKRKEAALEEAKLALEECDSKLRELESNDDVEAPEWNVCGRRVFGIANKPSTHPSKRTELNNYDPNDSDDEIEDKENLDSEVNDNHNNLTTKNVHINPGVLLEEYTVGSESVYKGFEDIVRDLGPKTTFEVSIFESDPGRKMKVADEEHENGYGFSSAKSEADLTATKMKNLDDYQDTDSEEEMIDGVLSSGPISEYTLPSQADIIHTAFAGDNVKEEFEREKLKVLNEENPEPEKPVLLPGWGQWTSIQKKKGLPSWMQEEYENAKTKREDALKKRKDAHLRDVVISEKVDKKAEKLYTKTLPFPFTNKEVFEQSIRAPIGPEFNPVTSCSLLNRPAVVKKDGIIIKPIKFEEVDPHDRDEEQKQKRHTTKSKQKSHSAKLPKPKRKKV